MFNISRSIQIAALRSFLIMAIPAVLMIGTISCSKVEQDADQNGRIATQSPGGDTVGDEMDMTTRRDNAMLNIMFDMNDDMKDMDLTGDIDYDMAQMMIEHHNGAIELANQEINGGANQELMNIAKKIKDENNKDIDKLEDFSTSYKKNMKNDDAFKGDDMAEDRYRTRMMAPMQQMINDIRSMNFTGNVDSDFATMMITHHQAGNKVANMIISEGKNAKLKEIARKNIAMNEKDINDLNKFRNQATSKLGK